MSYVWTPAPGLPGAGWYQEHPAYVPPGRLPAYVAPDQGGVVMEMLRGRLELAATCKYGWRVMAAHIADAAQALESERGAAGGEGGMTILEERLANLDALHLDKGSHASYETGRCAMEVVAWLAGEGITDAPSCASAVLRTYTISLNDTWSDADRQRLKPYLPRMVGTAGDGQDEARSYLALDWLIRSYTPAWMDLAGLTAEAQALRDLRRIADLVAVKEASTVVRAARDKAAAARDAAGAAAWDAAWDAAGAAARAAAGNAAWAAAGNAAGNAAWDAAWNAAWDAAWDAARAAAWDAAGAAATERLRPTVETLQVSALELLDSMIDPSAVIS